jgi:hypothetical protein
MKHAGPLALDRLEPLLKKLRGDARLKERTRGAFYRSGRAFLHFHEHGDELFADVRFGEDFERLPATSATHQAALMRRIGAALGDGNMAQPRSTSARAVKA